MDDDKKAAASQRMKDRWAEKRAAKAAKEQAKAAAAVGIDPLPTDEPTEREKFLLEQIEQHKKELGIVQAKLTASEQAIINASDAQWGTNIEEIPTGKTKMIIKCVGYKRTGFENGRVTREPIFEEVEVPTYRYKIDMAPCGGIDLKINDVAYYHGQTIEVDIDTLRTIKDTVYKTWAHDASVHGNKDENAYRPKTHEKISARGF